jgi:hypothetical protein
MSESRSNSSTTLHKMVDGQVHGIYTSTSYHVLFGAATRWHLLANQWRATIMKIGLSDLSTDMASATEEEKHSHRAIYRTSHADD